MAIGITMWISKIGGRKFLLAVAAMVIATCLQLKYGQGVTAEYTALLIGLVSAFTVGNAITKHEERKSIEATMVSNEVEVPQAATVDLTEVNQKLDQLGQGIVLSVNTNAQTQEILQQILGKK